MICLKCKNNVHYCINCGVEKYYYDYCSLKCLEEDGKIVCPVCHGWGFEGHEDEDPQDLLDLSSCKGYLDKND